jgi:hypothetical protein
MDPDGAIALYRFFQWRVAGGERHGGPIPCASVRR